MKLTAKVEANELLEQSVALKFLEEINISFPEDYIDFMLCANGGEGPIGDNSYIRLWPLQELKEANEDYAVHKFAPGLFLIGSDGGDTAYGIRIEDAVFVEVPFIGMADEEARVLSGSFAGFLRVIAEQ